ncbi:polysaccharide biosynthesis protein [Clostridium gasigenes]|uniref:polysaccharide biosynthesis protein n=1 Tax=Clostridium gasigenes TaxID=94869 RepID=UPI001C0CEDFF|nr:nucleoside-diphosphate sugar epimerase/dehydratase [Clostridium gasigenes]MBU3108865.1 polysaccharide biosynthesis protein [Clostridium gasigenes]
MGKENKLKALLLMIVDIILINGAYLASLSIRLGYNYPPIYTDIYKKNIFLTIIIYIVMLWIFKMYRSIWKSAGIDEVIKGVAACLIAGGINFIIMQFIPLRIPQLVTILSCVFITILILSVRLSFRLVIRLNTYGLNFTRKGRENIIIVGAGDCAQVLIEEIKKDKNFQYNIVGIIDDEETYRGIYLKGVRVIGNRNDILDICKKKNIDEILIAIPTYSSSEKKEILNICKEAKAKVKIVPSFYELIDNEQVSLKKMRSVDLRDLLGREEIGLDKDGISSYIEKKVVLVTGAGGSIGSELCRQIAKFAPKKIILLDIYENSVYDLQNELSRNMPKLDKEVIIASVRDKHRLNQIFREYKPQVIFHAAAHKHVPLMEFNPSEAIKNNVMGTLNLAECAKAHNVEKFVLISTDKAVNPTNVMGATKRLCEMIVQAMSKDSKTDFVAVRFGNVLGSNGSVIPLFQKQIENGGPVTLTHENITRYFMLIPEAAQLVLQAGVYANGGEIFVLDMGKPVKIYDLAENLIKLSGFEPHKDIKIKITGLRPGEKLYEELLMDEEDLKETKHEKIFIGKLAHFDLENLKKEIEQLVNIAENCSKIDLKVKLSEVVPTYIITENEAAVTKEGSV